MQQQELLRSGWVHLTTQQTPKQAFEVTNITQRPKIGGYLLRHRFNTELLPCFYCNDQLRISTSETSGGWICVWKPQWPNFLKFAHWPVPSWGWSCLCDPHLCPHFPLFSSYTTITNFLFPCLYPSSWLLKILHVSSNRTSKFLPSASLSFEVCIPILDAGSSEVWHPSGGLEIQIYLFFFFF